MKIVSSSIPPNKNAFDSSLARAEMEIRPEYAARIANLQSNVHNYCREAKSAFPSKKPLPTIGL